VMWIWPFEVAWKLRSVLQAQLRGTKTVQVHDFESLRNLMKPLMCVERVFVEASSGSGVLDGNDETRGSD